ncbi:hypothetical protein SPOG_03640 [Schizosaccharomyces cryophilus OY26]|uniref:WD-like domain-containing protein n=1 Tax=Schizosaccharomyces cryophilus (strain OY26 / ATCC MYA-4695 / CBS 11777 / NBRC 106824 / NRRL Y48691) TaxID=653667 RepID=S9XHE3_SCHCR|nr:uncharacterized protein SPOG_03640 [Schizosaccharomyces cryophilus OY26]EPY53096.1 hypothetical protein SPOG_03640 [Schizosaccharomyces cryophilus OY26]
MLKQIARISFLFFFFCNNDLAYGLGTEQRQSGLDSIEYKYKGNDQLFHTLFQEPIFIYSTNHYSEVAKALATLETSVNESMYGDAWYYYQYINSNSYLDPKNVEDFEWISDLKPICEESVYEFCDLFGTLSESTRSLLLKNIYLTYQRLYCPKPTKLPYRGSSLRERLSSNGIIDFQYIGEDRLFKKILEPVAYEQVNEYQEQKKVLKELHQAIQQKQYGEAWWLYQRVVYGSNMDYRDISRFEWIADLIPLLKNTEFSLCQVLEIFANTVDKKELEMVYRYYKLFVEDLLHS